jgi:hypothetical protein
MNSPYTTHIRYEPGAPSKLSGWRRFVGKDARGHSIQNIDPTVAVNQIASQQPSKYGLLFKWKVKRVKVAPTNVKHDVGYFVTKDSYVLTVSTSPRLLSQVSSLLKHTRILLLLPMFKPPTLSPRLPPSKDLIQSHLIPPHRLKSHPASRRDAQSHM